VLSEKGAGVVEALFALDQCDWRGFGAATGKCGDCRWELEIGGRSCGWKLGAECSGRNCGCCGGGQEEASSGGHVRIVNARPKEQAVIGAVD